MLIDSLCATKSVLRPFPKRVCLLALLLLAAAGMRADVFVNFESFSDSEILTNQIPGLQFTNTIVLSSGISLNQFDFPPHSGSNVASDNGGPIEITFDTSVLGGEVTGFSGYFTYFEPLTIQAFGSSSKLLATEDSKFSSNTGIGGAAGSAPNEFLQFSSTTGIDSILITGDPAGGSFTMDDLTFHVQPGGIIATPEPASIALLLGGLFAAVCWLFHGYVERKLRGAFACNRSSK